MRRRIHAWHKRRIKDLAEVVGGIVHRVDDSSEARSPNARLLRLG